MALCEVKLDKGCCSISGVLDFETVPSALEHLSRILLGNQSTVFDLKGVTASNSAGLAMLIELRAMASKKSLSIEINHIPSQILRLAEVSRLEAFFD